MHYRRRPHKFSRDLRRAKFPPLRYSRYARNKSYGRFYSEEELTKEEEMPKEAKEAFAVLAESLEDIEQAIERAEKEAEKKGETDELEKLEEEIEQEIEDTLKGKTNYSKLFRVLARGRLYALTPYELGQYESLPLQIATENLKNLITYYKKGKISEEDAEKSGLSKILEKKGSVKKWLLKFLARFTVSFLSYFVPRVVIASAIAAGLTFILSFLASIAGITIQSNLFIVIIFLIGFFLGLAGVYLIFAITRGVKRSIEKATSEDVTIMSMIYEVLRGFNNLSFRIKNEIKDVKDDFLRSYRDLSFKIQDEITDFNDDLDEIERIKTLIQDFKKENYSKIEQILERIKKDVPEKKIKEIEKKITQSKLGRYSSRRGAPSLMRHKRYSERGRRRGFYSDWD